MKVYVVIEIWYSHTDLVTCFRDKEQAKEFVEKQKNPISFSIIEMDVK